MKLMRLLAICASALVLGADAADRSRALMSALLRFELAGQVVANARKLSAEPAVAAAADVYRGRVVARIKADLTDLCGDAGVAQREFGAFVDAVKASPKDYAGLRAERAQGALAPDVAAAGRFLGDVEAWLRMKAKGETVPLDVWLARDEKPVAENPSAAAKPKVTKRKANPLRDSEADAGTFIEAKDDGNSALRSFGAACKARRAKALKDAEVGMQQVAAARKLADEEANAKKLAAAQAESAAQQAQAVRLADAEKEAVLQDQNSWKTRLKGVLTTAIGAAAGAFTGPVGARAGEAAAQSVFN